MNPQDPKSPEQYQSVAHIGEDTLIVEKSRFVGYSLPVASEEAAREFIHQLHQTHPQANHVCYAYVIGHDGLNKRFSDAGEPSGTAGVPMLEVLQSAGLVDIVVASVRYFGGVKLGTGGLARAYRKSATQAIAAGEVTTWSKHQALSLTIPYTLQGTVSYQLEKEPWLRVGERYDDKVHMDLHIPIQDVDACTEKIQNWCSGQAVLEWGDLNYQAEKPKA